MLFITIITFKCLSIIRTYYQELLSIFNKYLCVFNRNFQVETVIHAGGLITHGGFLH